MSMIRTWIARLCAVAMMVAALGPLAPSALAQISGGRLSGKVLDIQGNPYPDVAVTVTNKDTGQNFTTKTGKNGTYLQIGLIPGIYSVNFKKDNVNYTQDIQVQDGDNTLDVNFKEIAAKSGYNAAAEKEREDATKKFEGMKAHFMAGVQAMNDASATREALRTAQADQKTALQAKLSADYQTAITEFEAAKQGAPATDKNLPVVLGNLGLAYDGAGKYPEALAALQQAATLKPTPNVYEQIGTDLAKSGKYTDASAACDKAATLDPADKTAGENCYRNIGIVLTNSGDLKDAVPSLQKATELNPKDAQAWLLLGNALTATIDSKQENGKVVFIIPPGTAEAYQKCVALDPNGPIGAQAKAALQGLQQMGGAESTTVVEKKKKKN